MPHLFKFTRHTVRRLATVLITAVLGLVAGTTAFAQSSLHLNYPDAGDRLVVGDHVWLRWEHSAVDNIRIDYSLDGGTTWMEIINAVPAYIDSLQWVVPDTVTSQALVRVRDRADTSVSDASDAPFAIVRASVRIVSPNGGEEYELGDPIVVQWQSANVQWLRIEYSRDAGTSWRTVLDSVDASLGTASFVPPGGITEGGFVRAVDVERPRIRDVSDERFSLLPSPSIVIYSPSDGDEFVRGAKTIISWEAFRLDLVDIAYSLDGGATWTTIATNVSSLVGIMPWTVPTQVTDAGLIRIRQSGGNVEAIAGPFSIVVGANPSVRVILPNGGEHYTEGDTITVRWTFADVTSVDLYFSSDGGSTWTLIATGLAASAGRYDWVAPNAPGDRYRVRVVGTPASSDASDNDFEIQRRLHPAITLDYPNGGEVLTEDSVVTVRWAATDLTGSVDIYLSLDSGATWTLIGSPPVGGGTLSWTVPAANTMTALIRVDASGTRDTSDAVFAIHPKPIPQRSLVLLSPNAGDEVWHEGDTAEVTWESMGITQVDLHISADGGATWRTLAESLPSPDAVPVKRFAFIVFRLTDGPSQSMVVKVEETGDPSLYDLSDHPFSFIALPSAVGPSSVDAAATWLERAWPNPAVDMLHVAWHQGQTSGVRVQLYNERGELLTTRSIGRVKAGSHAADLDLHGVPAGSYRVVVADDHGSVGAGVAVVGR